jgi:trehalose 6-phosphate synthase/phosphatase
MNANEQIYGEKDERDKLAIEKDFNHVMKSSCKEWLYSFLKDIKNTKLSDDNIFYLGVGERFNFKLSKITKGFQRLEVQKILPDYQNSKRRLIFFDYEGTLPSMVSFDNAIESKGNRPSEEILNRLSELCEDKRNKVFIITGRGINLVSEWFGSVKDLGLAAEYGFLNKINTKNTQWRRLAKEYNNEWIENVIDLLQSYTERC